MLEICLQPLVFFNLFFLQKFLKGVQVPYTTPNLKKNYFEEQRLFARLHGLNIRTDPVEFSFFILKFKFAD